MKRAGLIIFIFSFACFSSCKKKRNYHIHGTLINEVTGTGHKMGGETIQLLQVGTRSFFFGDPEKRTLISEASTDNDGHFDFGVNELKEGGYRIIYYQGEEKIYYGVSNSFKDISLEKGTEHNDSISIIPTVKAISFIASPLLTTSINDTIIVEFVSETRLIKNPTYTIARHLTANELVNTPFRTFGGIDNSEFMGRIFIKLIKSYSGVRSTIHDTIFVEKDEFYRYYTAF